MLLHERMAGKEETPTLEKQRILWVRVNDTGLTDENNDLGDNIESMKGKIEVMVKERKQLAKK
jgi:hypothetical protein